MQNADPDEVGNAVYELLTKFNHTSLTYLISDLCQLQGWMTEVTKGNPSTGGDLIARNVLPHPQSVVILNQFDTKVDEATLQDLLAESTQNYETKYTVITAQQPTENALVFAGEHNIGIIGLGDIVEVILTQGVIELVVEYAKEDDQIVSTHEDLLLALDDGSQGFDDEHRSEEGALSEASAERPRNRPLSEDNRLSLGLVGYDTYVPDDSVEGVLVAVKLTAKEDTEITPSAFSLTFEDGTIEEAMSEAESPLVGKLESVLQPEWAVGNTSLNADESRRYILYVPTTTESPPATLSLGNLQIPMQPPISTQTFRGLPGPIVGVLNDLLGCSLTEGHQESYVSYGLDDQTVSSDREEPSVMDQNDVVSMSLSGFEYINADGFEGVLVGIELGSKDHDLRVSSDDFELHSANRFTYSGTDPADVDLTEDIADDLPPTWRTGYNIISGGGRINYLVLFPTDGRPELDKLRFSPDTAWLLKVSGDVLEDYLARSLHLELSPSAESRIHYNGALPDAIIDNISS